MLTRNRGYALPEAQFYNETLTRTSTSTPAPLIESSDSTNFRRFHFDIPPQPKPPALPEYPYPQPLLPRDPSFPEVEPSKPYHPLILKEQNVDLTCHPCLARDACFRLMYCSIFSTVIGLILISTAFFSGMFQSITGSKTLAPNETYKIELDTTRCQGATVTGDVRAVGVFDEEPPLNVTVSDNFIRMNTLPGEKYIFWSWNFYKGSQVNVSACSKAPNNLLFVFEGERNFSNWVNNNPNGETGTLYQTTINDLCSDGGVSMYQLLVKTSDIYYFVFYNPSSVEATLTTQFFLQRLEYDTSHPLSNCTSSPCTLYFRYSSTQFLIINTLDNYHIDQNLNIHWKCLPIPIYLLLFCILTGLCCGLPLWIYLFYYWPITSWTYCKKKTKI